ncbi:two-component sensor histidine kinase [Sporosarcina sp. P26b]|uniref:sensor histidine kinase n=1 Tax=unclassified Sporosarcina TaxID=2647733 RepID=UPI000C1662B6|nr:MULTISPECIES: sensor histidine kinase [unclassified Sporosarcina]PIC73580.1 two-component sensor histidine kinase [Sporosarcina sp. P17b]PIC96258.1 two-component sensor histidine kinase [Sporosarcina sp. P26b]
MKAIIGRTILLTLTFSAIVAVFFYFFIDVTLVEYQYLLFNMEAADMPLIAWLFSTIFIISLVIAGWIGQNGRTKENIIIGKLQDLYAKQEFTKSNKVKRKTNRSIEQLYEVLEAQRNSLRRITDERVETQDKLIQERIIQERQRLARELHDSVSQQLFAASMLLSALAEQAEEGPIHKPLLQVEKMVQQAQLEMRALLLHLRPAALHNQTLAKGLEELLSELQQKVTFDITHRLEDIELSKGAEDHLFRIAQETLSNTLRHAKATEVEILLIERDGLAILRVQDNGVGFKQDDGKGGSYGLQNVKERAIEIGGSCKIVSVPSQGTIVEVKLPILKGELADDSSAVGG